MNEKISVVIPTRNRPILLRRAINSALSQTYKEIEIIVVIDGPDDETIKSLEQIKDSKIRILALPTNVGGSDARNAGVKAANGEWIAFLDDDDEWFPEKLTKQMEIAGRSNVRYPVIANSVIGRTPLCDFVWPTRMPRPDEPISEYIFARNLTGWEGLLQTSTWLIKRELLAIVPFRSGLKKHQDTDWILRASSVKGVRFDIIMEPLSVWYVGEQRRAVGSEPMWKYSLKWLRDSRELFTSRAYASCVSAVVAQEASLQGEWRAFFPLLWEMCRFGKPTIFHLFVYMGMWFMPQKLRRMVRAFLKKASVKS